MSKFRLFLSSSKVGPTTDICYCSKLQQVFSFMRFLLTGFQTSACWSEEHNKSAKGNRKQGYYFHR